MTYPGPYYSPEKFGLEIIGKVDWSDGYYQYDYTTVWYDPTTREFLYGNDAGCSCPLPFEDVQREHLNVGTRDEIHNFLKERLKRVNREELDRCRAEVADLTLKMRKRERKGK